MNIFRDKVVIITGASRGIGLAIARIFAQEGAKLVLTAKQNTGLLDVFNDAKIVKLDLADKKGIDLLVDETIKSLGKIDILVNNAAVYRQADFETISEQDLDYILDVDLKGPILLMQKVFTQMKKQKKGKIINIASGAGKMGSSKASHYAACKAAMISLTKSLAKAGGPYSINVNAVAPGFIGTEMISAALLEKKEAIESVIPLKRIGRPEDVAGVVMFLASGDSDYITGQTICVDGGHCMI